MKKSSLRYIRYSAFLLLGLVMFSGCGIQREPDWYIVTGSGTAPEAAMNAQETLLAKRAAELDARRKLLETARGVAVQSDTTVQDFMTVRDNVRTNVFGVIRNAEILDTRYYHDGTCEVDMRLDMNRIKEAVR